MYIYMGMFFNSQQDVPDFGSIAMYYVGTKDLGYVEEGHKRFRKYTFQSTDLNKLSLITNAIDGSEAFAVDTGTTYVLYDGQWSIKSSEITPEKMSEMLGNITQIDYQVVNQLPQTGVKGTIYLVANQTALGDYYDEYIWTTRTYNSNGETITENIYEKIGNTAPTISTMIGATENANGEGGLVPAPSNSRKNYFLKGDGTWGNPHDVTQQLESPINLDVVWTKSFNTDVVTYGGNRLYYIFNNAFLSHMPSSNDTHNQVILNNDNTISFSNNEISTMNGPNSGFLQIKIIYDRNNSNWSEEETLYDMLAGKIYKRCFYITRYGNPYSGYVATPTDWTQIYPIEDLFIPKVIGATGKVAKFAEDGSIESTNYELNKTVPADAVFTDTTYTLIQDQLDGHKITFTPSNGNATVITIPNNDATYEDATQSVHGLMSASDKTKLDEININNYRMKSDTVICTEDEYNSLATKTAEFYYIIEED